MMNYPVPQVSAVPAHPDREPSIGHILVELGKLTPDDIVRVLRLQKQLGLRFGEVAQQLGLINAFDVQQVLARQFKYPYLQSGQGPYPLELGAAYRPFTAEVDVLRALRTELMLRWFGKGHKALAIAGVSPRVGNSLLVANLAVLFSQMDRRTLIVDANMRDPRQHKIFGLQNGQGLSDILAGRAGMETVVKDGLFANLSVLQCGTLPPNPEELIGRSAFSVLNDSITRQFDVVLYDTPALSTNSDAIALAARLGGVVLAVQKNKTRLNDVTRIKEQILGAGADIVGSVLLDV
jgi:chain length determinant protein tyrosine kinase EpsG